MPKVLRTPVPPGRPVEHDCLDRRGRPVRATGRSGELCRSCNTWLVYVRSAPATPPAKEK